MTGPYPNLVSPLDLAAAVAAGLDAKRAIKQGAGLAAKL